jgi:hypothetical protein
MGYYMEQRNHSFFIDKEDKKKALQAIKDLMLKANKLGSKESWGGVETYWFAWVDTSTVKKAQTLEEALLAWRYDTQVDGDGNINYIWFCGEKLGDDMYILEAIAPYVADGSFIEMQGEDGSLWRWLFEKGGVKEVAATISWGDTI